ncbi:MAG: VOC family protein [Ignavibacteriales bacterium]
MKISKIDHVGILVRDLESAMRLYSDVLGIKPALIEENEAYHVKIAFMPVGGVLVELLEPTDRGGLQEWLDQHGEGIDHVAFKVDDIDRALEECRRAGVPLADETPKPGGAGARVAFLKREAANGVSIELKEGGTDLT